MARPAASFQIGQVPPRLTPEADIEANTSTEDDTEAHMSRMSPRLTPRPRNGNMAEQREQPNQEGNAEWTSSKLATPRNGMHKTESPAWLDWRTLPRSDAKKDSQDLEIQFQATTTKPQELISLKARDVGTPGSVSSLYRAIDVQSQQATEPSSQAYRAIDIELGPRSRGESPTRGLARGFSPRSAYRALDMLPLQATETSRPSSPLRSMKEMLAAASKLPLPRASSPLRAPAREPFPQLGSARSSRSTWPSPQDAAKQGRAQLSARDSSPRLTGQGRPDRSPSRKLLCVSDELRGSFSVPEVSQVARHPAIRTRSPVRFAAEVEACNMTPAVRARSPVRFVAEVEACNMTPAVRARSPVRLQAVQVMASMDGGVRPEHGAYTSESSWNSEMPVTALQLLKDSIHREMQVKIRSSLDAHLQIINSQLASLGERLLGEDIQGRQLKETEMHFEERFRRIESLLSKHNEDLLERDIGGLQSHVSGVQTILDQERQASQAQLADLRYNLEGRFETLEQHVSLTWHVNHIATKQSECDAEASKAFQAVARARDNLQDCGVHATCEKRFQALESIIEETICMLSSSADGEVDPASKDGVLPLESKMYQMEETLNRLSATVKELQGDLLQQLAEDQSGYPQEQMSTAHVADYLEGSARTGGKNRRGGSLAGLMVLCEQDVT